MLEFLNGTGALLVLGLLIFGFLILAQRAGMPVGRGCCGGSHSHRGDTRRADQADWVDAGEELARPGAPSGRDRARDGHGPSCH